jgi:acyl-CoA thioesterase FadM
MESIKMKYLKTTFYDEQLIIKTTLKALEGRMLLYFTYRIYNEQKVLINEGETNLAFVNSCDWQLSGAPDFVINAIDNYNFRQSYNLY